MQITLRPLSTEPMPVTARNSPLADPKWGLAWSNPGASAEALVSKALLKGSFSALIEAVFAHGMPFVRAQWDKLCAFSDDAPTQRIHIYVENLLANIEEGLQWPLDRPIDLKIMGQEFEPHLWAGPARLAVCLSAAGRAGPRGHLRGSLSPREWVCLGRRRRRCQTLIK